MVKSSSAVLVLVTLVSVVLFPEVATRLPWVDRLSPRFPSLAVATPEGGILVNDLNPSGNERLTKINERGQVVFRLDGGDRSGNYNFNYPVCDEQGRIYFVRALWNLDSGQREDFALVRLEADGTAPQQLFHHSNTEEELADGSSGFLDKIQYSEGKVYFLSGYSTGSVTLHQLDTANGTTDSRVIETETDQTIVDFAVATAGRIVLLTASYQLLEVSGSTVTALPSSPNEILITINGVADSIVAEDALGQNIVEISPSGGRKVLLARTDPGLSSLVAEGFSFPQLFLSKSPLGWLVPDSSGNRILQLRPNEPPLIRNSFAILPSHAVVGWVFWFALALAAGLFLFQGIGLVRRRIRIPIYVKQLAIFVPFLVASLTLAAQIVFGEYDGKLEQEAEKQFLSIAQAASRTINAGPLERLRNRDDLTRPDVQQLFQELDLQVNQRLDPWNQDLYTYIYLPDPSGTFKFGFNNGAYFTPFALTAEDKRILSGQSPAEARNYTDVTGTWTSAVAPLYNAERRIVGLFEVYKSSVILEERRVAFTIRTLLYALAVVTAFTVLYFLSTYFILHGIKLLVRATERMASNDFTSRIHLSSRDEIEDLSHHFNRMAGEVESRMGHIAALNTSYYRFVPEAFLKLLDKDITAIGLGDKVEREVTILFSDIRDFTPLSETMSPEESFRFLNRYLECMGPVIRQHGGFIDKYIGDGIMAIFPDDPEQAVQAGLAMARRLEGFNEASQSLSLSAIRIGIGINTGRAMLGVIGEHQRFECTVISDTVNLAARLESATKDFGVPVLVSLSTRHQGTDPAIVYRPLGTIQVKGRREPVEVFAPESTAN